MVKFFLILMRMALNFAVGAIVFALAEFPPAAGGTALAALSLTAPALRMDSCLCAGIYTEVWTGEMIKAFRTSMESIGWLNRIRNYDQYVDKESIHFVDIGGDPDVLINNYTYPLPIQDIADADKTIALEKYETKPTRITDDELFAISYDKMSSIIERHRDAINGKRYSKALWNLSPAVNTAGKTPVLKTTGAITGSRKALVRTDLISLKSEFDKQGVPSEGRVLVLCSDHVNDLLSNDQKFADQYYNYTTGKISNLYGFEIYEYNDTPYYVLSTLARLAYGSAPGATERQASIAFYARRMMKATGTTKTYLSEAKDHPTAKENLVSFTTRFICLPLKNETMAAIVSDKSS